MPAPSTAVIVLLAAALAASCQPADEFPGTRADSIAVGAARPVGPPPPPLPEEVAGPAPAATDTGRVVAGRTGERAEPEPVLAPDTSPPRREPAAPAIEPRPSPDTALPDRPVRAEPRPTPPPPPPIPAGDCDLPQLGPEPGTRIVTVYFTCAEQVRPVRRQVTETQAVLRAALEQLLGGPTDEELLAGFHSFFSPVTAGKLIRVAVGTDGIARIDFEDFSSLIPNASSSTGSEQLLGQLRATIFQFPTVRAATLTFDGDCDAFWNWLQRGCEQITREP